MKASAEQEDRKCQTPKSGRITAMEAAQEPPHPASWAALQAQLVEERKKRIFAEEELQTAQEERRMKDRQLMMVIGDRLRLRTLILELHLEQGEEDPGFVTARMEIEREGQKIHGCHGGACSAWSEFDDDNETKRS